VYKPAVLIHRMQTKKKKVGGEKRKRGVSWFRISTTTLTQKSPAGREIGGLYAPADTHIRARKEDEMGERKKGLGLSRLLESRDADSSQKGEEWKGGNAISPSLLEGWRESKRRKKAGFVSACASNNDGPRKKRKGGGGV